jgi:hypothetical protein
VSDTKRVHVSAGHTIERRDLIDLVGAPVSSPPFVVQRTNGSVGDFDEMLHRRKGIRVPAVLEFSSSSQDIDGKRRCERDEAAHDGAEQHFHFPSGAESTDVLLGGARS